MDQAQQYESSKYRASIAGFVLDLLILIYLLSSGWSIRIRDLAGSITASRWIVVMLYTLVIGAVFKIVELPLGFIGIRARTPVWSFAADDRRLDKRRGDESGDWSGSRPWRDRSYLLSTSLLSRSLVDLCECFIHYIRRGHGQSRAGSDPSFVLQVQAC